MTAASAALQTQLAALLGLPACAHCRGAAVVYAAGKKVQCGVCCGRPAQLPRKAKRVCARAQVSL